MSASKQLTDALCTTFAFYLRAHGFHWNVEGPDFLQYHDLFGKIADDVYGSIDPMAEEIRALNQYAPISLTEMKAHSAIVDDQNAQNNNPRSMVLTLASENGQVIESLKKAFDAAQAEGNQGLMDFLAGRLDAHAKWAWFLRATSKS